MRQLKRAISLSAAVGALLVLPAAADAAVFAGASEVSAYASADASDGYGGVLSHGDPETASGFGAPVGPLTATAHVWVAGPIGFGMDHESLSLQLADARHGTVSAAGSTEATIGMDASFADAAGDGSATYAFTSDHGFRLDYDYVLASTGTPLGAPYSIALYDVGAGAYLFQDTVTGASSGFFLAGPGDYVFEFRQSGADRVFTASNTIDGASSVGLAFAISDAAVAPEPASWALILTGFGLAGFALRRQARRGRA